MRTLVTFICLITIALAGWFFTLNTSAIRSEVVMPMYLFVGCAGIAAFYTIPIIWGVGPTNLLQSLFVATIATAVGALYWLMLPYIIRDWHITVPVAIVMAIIGGKMLYLRRA